MLGIGRLLDLAPAPALDPSARTTFKKISIYKKTLTAHHNDAQLASFLCLSIGK